MLKHSHLPCLSLGLLLLVGPLHAQTATPTPKPSPAPSSAEEYASLTPPQIIIKLQGQIIGWQDTIIKGTQAAPVARNLLTEMASVGANTQTGEIKDQKMLDLLAKNGINITLNDGKKISTATQSITKVTPDVVPMIVVPPTATAAEKKQIRELLEKATSLIDQANYCKQTLASFQTIVEDLLTLARTDEGAQGIVKKYNIQQHSAATPTPAQ